MKPSEEDALLRLAARISDGEPIDPREIESMDLDPCQLRLVRHLQTVANIASAQDDKNGEAAPGDEEGQTRWGHLVILAPVGGGAYGEVLKAWDPQLEREVALKLLHRREDGEEGSEQDKLIDEARLLARITDPNVATVYGAAVHDGQAGIWMEFVRGRTLQDIVEEQGPCSAGEAVVMGMEVCRAAAMVHKAGVVHRDIKAQNIIRGEGGRIVLTDFGSGYSIPPEGGDGMIAVSGTPLYMAPEVLDGGEPTPQSDIYSIGVLLFFLLSGTYPVRGNSLREIRRGHGQKIRQRLSETRPQLPHSVCRIVEKALQPKPERRYRSARQMEDALAAALTDSGLGIEQVRRPSWPLKPGWLLAGSAALLASIAIFFLLVAYLTPEVKPLRVIVEDLELSFSASEIPQIETQLNQVLAGSRRFRYLPREELKESLTLTRLRDKAIDQEAAQTLMLRGFADLTLAVGVEGHGQDIRLSLQVYAPQPLGRLAYDWISVHEKRLGEALAGILRPTLAKLEKETEVFPEIEPRKVTTGSLPALRHFLQAERLYETSLSDSAESLKVAIDEDPLFASAFQSLSLLQSALGDSKSSLHSIASANDLLDEITVAEREIIEVQFLQMTGQHKAARDEASKAIARIDNQAAYFLRLLANDYNRLGSPREAIDSLRDAVDLEPGNWFEYEKRIAFMMVLAEDLQPALELVAKLHEERPLTPYVLWTESLARMALGDFERAQGTLLALQKGQYGPDKRAEDRVLYNSVGYFYQAQMALLRGNHRKALELLEAHPPKGYQYNNGFLRYQSSLRLAHLLFLDGQEQLALSKLDCLLEDDFPPQFLYMLRDAAMLLGFFGYWEKRDPFVEKLRSLHGLYPGWLSERYLSHLEAEDALRKGRPEVARSLIGSGQDSLDDILSLWSLARLYESEDACSLAVIHYREILSQRGRVIYWQSPDILALASYRAVRCYREMGQPEEGRKILEDLKAFWHPDDLGIQISKAAETDPHQDTSK